MQLSDLWLPLSQVQGIVDIANNAFSLLQKLSASLRATSKTAVGKPTDLLWGASACSLILKCVDLLSYLHCEGAFGTSIHPVLSAQALQTSSPSLAV